MSLKRFSRAGLVALAATVLFGIVLSAPTYHTAAAQAPAATSPAPAAAPAATPDQTPAAPAAELSGTTW